MARLTPRVTGFSLVELLVVLAVVVILMALASQSFIGVQQGYRLSQAGVETAALIEFARKKAIAANQLVELRFIRGNSEDHFRHVAILVIEADGTRKVAARTFSLSDGLAFLDDPSLSPLLALSPGVNFEPIPKLGSSYAYRSFLFRPDGTTDLPWSSASPQRYFVTLAGDKAEGAPPANYFSVEVDPLSGRTRTHRP